jgi:hypothetical protein
MANPNDPQPYVPTATGPLFGVAPFAWDGAEWVAAGAANPLPVTVVAGAGVLGGAGANVSLTLSWAGGVVVASGTYLFTGTAAYGFDIGSLDASVGSAGGAITAEVRNAGTDVGGLSAVAVTAPAKTRFLASGANFSVAAGSTVDVVLTVTGAPTDAFLVLNGVKT